MPPLVLLLAVRSFWPYAPPAPQPFIAQGQLPVTSVPLNQPTLAPLVERVTPAVVNITVAQPSPFAQNPLLCGPYFRRFLPEGVLRRQLSAGSGVSVDAAPGLRLTNHHVIDNPRAVEVTLKDRFSAEIVGSDLATVVAVLRIRARGLTALPLGNSDGVRVGDYVMAVGNSFGLGQTVTGHRQRARSWAEL